MKVAPKQEYRSPKLLVYGELSQITKGNASGAKSDHAGGKTKSG